MQGTTENTAQDKIKRITYWVMLIVIALIFVPSGIMKLISNEKIVENFSKWGLLDYMPLIGIAELLFTLLIFVPRTRLLGYLALTAIMGGAIYTHHKFDEPFYFPVAITVVMWITYFAIKPKRSK